MVIMDERIRKLMGLHSTGPCKQLRQAGTPRGRPREHGDTHRGQAFPGTGGSGGTPLTSFAKQRGAEPAGTAPLSPS